MKAIEDKINEIVEGHAESRWLDAGELREYLEEVAAEQKAIDDDHFRDLTKMLIDKACKAHCSCCPAYSACSHRGKFCCWALTRIRKAMEE